MGATHSPSQKQRIGTTGQVGSNRLCGANLKYTKPKAWAAPGAQRSSKRVVSRKAAGPAFWGKLASELEIPKTMGLVAEIWDGIVG